MTMRVITAEAKVAAISFAIEIVKKIRERRSPEMLGLKEIAKDMRARAELPRNLALGDLERAMKTLETTKTELGFDLTRLRNVADTVVRHWPTIQQALERYGEESAE